MGDLYGIRLICMHMDYSGGDLYGIRLICMHMDYSGGIYMVLG